MPKNERQKLKLLYLKKILEEKTPIICVVVTTKQTFRHNSTKNVEKLRPGAKRNRAVDESLFML